MPRGPNKAPTRTAHIYVRCLPELKERLENVLQGMSESRKVIVLVERALDAKLEQQKKKEKRK